MDTDFFVAFPETYEDIMLYSEPNVILENN